MALKFTQLEVESELRDCFKQGTIRGVAIEAGINETYLARGLNPNNEFASAAYQYLQVQCGLDAKDLVAGDEHWEKVKRFREMSISRSVGSLSLENEITKGVKEDADCVISYVGGESLYEQLAEVDEAIRQKKRTKAAILEAITREKLAGATSFRTRN
jgi:hypothetical protein